MNGEYYNINNSGNFSSARWLTEEVFKLIDIVQKDQAIYNPRHKYYFCRPYVENFWRDVDLKLEKNPGASLAKWTNLRISFRREYTNYLEEKLPPCWTYFDRMFFLHPYLRKKHSHNKTIDTQKGGVFQKDSVDRLGDDSVRSSIPNTGRIHETYNNSHKLNHKFLSSEYIDNYVEDFDNIEQTNVDMDDVIENEQNEKFPNIDNQSLNNDVKSECEDRNDEYEDILRTNRITFTEEEHDEEAVNFSWDASDMSCNKKYSKVQQLRSQPLQRFQARYYEEHRPKRPRSNGSIVSSISIKSSEPVTAQRIYLGTVGQNQSNISFVRPTLNKLLDVVNSTTISNNHEYCTDNETSPLNTLQSSSIQSKNVSMCPRNESASNSLVPNNLNTNTSIIPVTPTHLDLCDCKTDPDAMFLMSLLPDIQKLNGRDRGKIKIAFQNILQDYLYPD